MEEQKINALVNIGQSKVVEKVYEDLLTPPSKKAGQALSTILDIGNTVLWPIKWVNERTRIFFENNIKKYEESISKISEEKIVTVPTEISKPILDRFTYVSNEELSNAFVNLLLTASSSDTISIAHPGFISVIDRLSPDEARILTFLKVNDAIPSINIKCLDLNGASTYVYAVYNETGIQKQIELTYPQNIGIYLDNLESLGLIQKNQFYYTELEEEFKKIEIDCEESFNSLKKDNETEEQHKQRKGVEKFMYRVTGYGKLFIDAIIK